MSVTCASIRRQLSWFVGGDLDRDRGREVAAHLAECLPCRRQAAGLQQAGKALASLGDEAGRAAVAGVDEAMFASLHAEITAAVADETVGQSMLNWPRALWLAAAMLLFGLGWWLARAPETIGLLDRPPIPAVAATTGDAALVLPWAGPRAWLRPLGYDDSEAEAGAGRDLRLGSGMMCRHRLRTLEGELLAPRLLRRDR